MLIFRNKYQNMSISYFLSPQEVYMAQYSVTFKYYNSATEP